MKKFYLPIFWKFSIAILVIVLTFASINAFLIWQKVYGGLQEESEKRGVYIARSLAEQIIKPLLYEDFVQVQELIDGTKKIDKTIYYIFVKNRNNEVVVHSFESAFPAELLKISTRDHRKKKEYYVHLINPRQFPGVLIRDIAVEIFNGELGVLHVGILEASIQERVNDTIWWFWVIVGIFLLAGIGGAFGFAYFITSPIKSIQYAADALDLSEMNSDKPVRVQIRKKFLGKWDLLFRAMDEIDYLSQKFNEMLKRLEETYITLNETNRKLIRSEKLAVVGTISAGVAHEINNPIAGMKNCLRRIKNNPENLEQNQKYIEMMENAVNRIEAVVRQLLNFSRQQEFNFTQVNLAQVIENAKMLLSYRFEKENIDFMISIENSIPPIVGSPHHLEQVLVNLIINALDAIEEKCNKNCDCKREIEIVMSVKKKKVVVEIADSGVGIKPEEKEKILEPFYTTKKIGKGTGLGLAVSYNIILAHHGDIKFFSTPGESTRVVLTFPIMEAGDDKN